MKTNKITSEDMPKIDTLDKIKGSLEAENSLKGIEHREPLSPDLANIIRKISLWKLINSHKLGKISKEEKINQIISTIKRPVNIERYCMKTINKNLNITQN